MGLHGGHEAGAHELAVEKHGAGAALALLAGVLRAGQLEPVAERREQAVARPGVGLARLAVHGERDPHARHRSSARAGEHAQRVATVRGRPADVVDRARRRCDPLGKRLDVVQRRRDEPDDWSGGAERSAHLAALAVGDDGERADRDDHGVSRSDLHEGLRRAARRDVRGQDELVVGERVPLDADEEVLERHAARAAHARDLDLRALDEERRQRVACGRRGSEIPADRPAVADLRRADGARRLRERRQDRSRASPTTSVYVRPAPSRSVPFSRDQPRSSETSFRFRRTSGRAQSKLSATMTSVPPWIGSASGCSALSTRASSSERGVRTSMGTF